MTRTLFFLLLNALIIGCSATRELNHPSAYATLWVQNAAEYDALTRQVYNAASSRLTRALEDSYWTAATEQEDPYFGLPPAVILDVDETVLDNAPFQARMIKQNSSFNPTAWSGWVQEAKADPVPGALDFTNYAERKGVTVFYVTNRDSAEEAATRKNLREKGFPLAERVDVILTRKERENWTSDKTSRRKFLAKNYRILMLIGDDLNDFVSAKGIPMEQRDELVRKHTSKWNNKWFILPNPVYGSWEQALYGFDTSLNEFDIRRIMKEQFDTKH